MKIYILISVAVIYVAVASMGNPTRPDDKEDNDEEALEPGNCADLSDYKATRKCSKQGAPCCNGKGTCKRCVAKIWPCEELRCRK